MKSPHPFVGLCLLLAAALAPVPVRAANPILFVTQVPMPVEVNSRTASQSVMSVSSAFGNHLGTTASCGRGGALLILYPGVTQPRDLTAAANYGPASTVPAQRQIAVRQPSVHWGGARALFSMVVGAPTSASDPAVFFWQIYEITNFANGQTPTITLVPGQPPNANNVSPTYGTDDHVIFTSDLPRDPAAPHLYPQRDEYLLLPTVSGLWTLDPVAGLFTQLQHAPSGAFSPFVDSFGRVIYTRWDHLSRDPQGTTDREPGAGDTFAQTDNGTFNYLDETLHVPTAAELGTRAEIFPEPRNFDHSGLVGTNLNGNAFNQFFPWMLTEDGTGEETLNHVGRHELSQQIDPSYTNDPKLLTMTAATRPAPGSTRFLANLFQVHEDPLNPGTYYGINAPDVGYHATGQAVRIAGSPTTAPAVMQVTYVTAPVNVPAPPQAPLANAADIYHAVVPFQDGRLVAVHTPAKSADANTGTATSPAAAYTFRLKTLAGTLGTMTPGANLTPGLSANVSYFTPAGLTTYNGPLWELDPAEVVARPRPARVAPGGLNPGAPPANGVTGLESQVFAEEGVDVPTFQSFLRRSRLALVISRNVTTRDAADRQQPFNLKVTGSPTATAETHGLAYVNGDKIYGVGVMQFLQADQRRGLTFGTAATPAAGRRVLATPMHDVPGAEQPVSENPPAPNGAPAGSVVIGDDGSMASFVPGGRAVTYHLLDAAPTYASQVKERYWLTFAPGEIRTCASCHGVNATDQAGSPAPANKPNALRGLLRNWKTNHPPGAAQCADGTLTVPKTAGAATVSVARVGGNTGTASVAYSTVNGSAVAGQDFAGTSGTLTWIDGDSAPKTVSVPLLHNPVIAPDKTFTLSLTGGTPAPGSPASTVVTLQEPPFARWQLQRFPASEVNDPLIAGPNADPDGDGVPNLLEYANSHDPKSPDAAPLAPFPELDPNDGKTYLTLVFHRRLAPRDITYHLEVSTDLSTWSEAAASVQLFPASDDSNGTTESVKARAATPLGQVPRQFLRLRVTAP